jgi:hypothetical protein
MGEQGERTAGWDSDLPTFRDASAGFIRRSLEEFVREPGPLQLRAWDESIPLLQCEAAELIDAKPEAREYGAILEYQLPLEERRPDVVVLAGSAVVVLELKGKQSPSQADIDQVAAYARDLRAYHRECQDREVAAVLVPTRASPKPRLRDGVWVVGPAGLDALIAEFAAGNSVRPATLREFLDPEAYRPLPTIVEAARELFQSRTIREIWRAKAATDPAVEAISRIAHEAARSRTRHLVLVTGVPGAGKTLVGMRVVHASFLDDLAISRGRGKPTVPGLYLTGNGPLAQVLQYELKKAGGGGKTFVRHIKAYLDRHVPRPDLVPSEHLLVFDEAQRAFSEDMVAAKHQKWPSGLARSEPEHFVEICGRMPEWSVLVGLIGGGQEIYVGEEGGLVQWRHGLEACESPETWTVHAPAEVEAIFADSPIQTRWSPDLNLDTAIRFHLAGDLHRFVAAVLAPGEAEEASRIFPALWSPKGEDVDGIRLWITRDLGLAKAYLRDRYSEDPGARYGILASSRDKSLPEFDVDNSFFGSLRHDQMGPWITEGDEHHLSCRHLGKVATEFGVQGLELEMALVAWGTDFMREGRQWTNRRERRYGGKNKVKPRDPFRMRQNTYRVLLTRGRDGTIVFVPRLAELDDTYEHLTSCGFRELRD